MAAQNPKDLWTGIIYITIGLAAGIISLNYELGTPRKMGPAFFPLILSSLLILIGIITTARSFIRPGTPVGSFSVRGLLLVTGATVLFGFIIRGAGMIIALPALVMVGAYGSRAFSWRTSVILSIGLTVFCIFVFLKGLGIPLPIVGVWFGR